MDVKGVHYDEVILLKTLVGEEGWVIEPWTELDQKGGVQAALDYLAGNTPPAS